jgi:ferric-dicitrate binding protein FerR (iron transport regulator)
VEHQRSSSPPESEREFQEFRETWTAFECLGDGLVGPPPSAAAIARTAGRRRSRARWLAVLRSPRTGLGLAAAAALAFLVPWDRLGRREAQPPGGLTAIETTSSLSGIVTLGLSDGSFVRITRDTRIEFPRAAGRRDVVLAGRGFFAVAADSTPFVVRTEIGTVAVLGTRFEVVVDERMLRVVVLEGTVRLAGPGGQAEVSSGQVGYLSGRTPPRVVGSDDVLSLMDWPGGLLVFRETPLSQVAEEVARHFGRTVSVRDERLRPLRVTAWFGNETLEEITESICLLVGARCVATATGVDIATQGRGRGP